jgi:predicted nucleotidyltransferase
VREVDPEQIVLFGSRARGEARASSDLDLLIVEGPAFRADRTRWGEIRRIRRALSGFRVPKDILVYSKDEVAKWRGSVNHIIAGGLREGRVLYERS